VVNVFQALTKTSNYTCASTDVLVVSTSGANTYTLASAASAGVGRTVHFYSRASQISVHRPVGNALYNAAGVNAASIGSLWIGTFISDGVSSWYYIDHQ